MGRGDTCGVMSESSQSIPMRQTIVALLGLRSIHEASTQYRTRSNPLVPRLNASRSHPSGLRIPRSPRRAIVLNNRVAIPESMKVDGRVSQDVKRAGQCSHGSLSRHRRQSLDGSPLTANSRNLNRRPNALFQTTTNAAIAANTTTAMTPKTGLINCKALQPARMRASSGRIPPSVFTSNLPLLWQAHFLFARLSRVAAAVPQPVRGRILSAHLVRHSLPK